MIRRIRMALLLFVSCLAGTPLAWADWKSDLESSIERRYKLAKLTLLRDNVREPGTVLLLVQPGVVADRDSHLANRFRVDRPTNASGTSTVSSPGTRPGDATPLSVGLPRFQPVFVTSVLVSKSRVTLDIATNSRYVSETVDREAIARFVTGQSLKNEVVNRIDIAIRRAALVFDFGQSDLRTTPIDVVIEAIDQVVLPADDPRVPQFGTVAIGMSREKAIMNLGPPKNTIVLSDREILVYDNIKVMLVQNQVTDVQ